MVYLYLNFTKFNFFFKCQFQLAQNLIGCLKKHSIDTPRAIPLRAHFHRFRFITLFNGTRVHGSRFFLKMTLQFVSGPKSRTRKFATKACPLKQFEKQIHRGSCFDVNFPSPLFCYLTQTSTKKMTNLTYHLLKN